MLFEELKREALAEFSRAENFFELEKNYKKYLGRKGKLTQLLRSLGNLEPQERAQKGKELNELKLLLQEEFSKKKSQLEKKELEILDQKDWLDVTAPGIKFEVGHLHPLSQVITEIQEIFMSMGFEQTEGPEIETEYYNFEALNIPKDHPARDIWDTFWLSQKQVSISNSKSFQKEKPKLLLRTHTSPVQIRYMEKHWPPFRIIALGRCFRHEATDATHDVQFYQIEGLMVGERVRAADFRGVIDQFFLAFFKKPVKTRLRPSYFPFTEPSFEVDLECLNCQAQGCRLCKQSGYLEMLGAGLVHPKVFEAVKYPAGRFQGFAFGLGIDRLAMLKFKIPDIRFLYSGDLRILKQF